MLPYDHGVRWLVSVLALQAVALWAGPSPSRAQDVPPADLPAEIEAIARQMQFAVPTRIAGRLMTLDAYDDAVWLEWTGVFADGGWKPVPPERQFVVYPKNKSMMDFLRSVPRGTILRMTVQRDTEGKRRIVELEGT